MEKKDFYNYVNSSWISSTTIPKDKKRWGTFSELQEQNEKKIEEILNDTLTTTNLLYSKIGILYSQALNNELRKTYNDFNVLKHILSNIKSATSKEELFNLSNHYQYLLNFNFPINYSVQPNFNNSSINILHLTSGGLGLPDRDYYFLEKKKHIRDQYLIFMQNYIDKFKKYYPDLLNDFNIQSIYNIEIELAKNTHTKVQKRDTKLINNVITFDEFIKRYPNLTFIKNIFDRVNKIPNILNITNPDYMSYLNNLIDVVSLDDWKNYIIYKIILETSDLLTNEIQEIFFNFYSKIINGIEEMTPKNIMAQEIVNSYLGELVGKLYCDKYFNEQSRKLVKYMVKLIKNVLNDYLEKNYWMSDDTKKEAINKLNKINLKIGYPKKLSKKYEDLDISFYNSFIVNIMEINKFNIIDVLKKIDMPVDKDKWFMNSQDINAYYAPNFNEIVFPAGILQSPLFSLNQDMAYNFGGIGMVIGHEITHGFDDQGCNYDADGNIRNWWNDDDKRKYKEQTEIIKKQFDSYLIEGHPVNGSLTLGENISDLGGLRLSYYAYMKFLKKFPEFNVVINDLTPQQRFFFNYANIWKNKSRKEYAVASLQVDPHAPPIYRVNGILKHMKEFHYAFKFEFNDENICKLWQLN